MSTHKHKFMSCYNEHPKLLKLLLTQHVFIYNSRKCIIHKCSVTIVTSQHHYNIIIFLAYVVQLYWLVIIMYSSALIFHSFLYFCMNCIVSSVTLATRYRIRHIFRGAKISRNLLKFQFADFNFAKYTMCAMRVPY